MSTTATAERASTVKATITGLNHIAIPVRDPAEAVRFWTTLLGAQLLGKYEDDTFAIMMMPGGFMMGFSKQPDGWTKRKAEYPHVGFDVAPDALESLKRQLEELGVPTDRIWTRFRGEALMYFRDPSGNLYELYCHEGYDKAKTAPLGIHYGGDYTTDLESLNYDSWNDPGK